MGVKKYINTGLANPLSSIYMLLHRMRRLARLDYLFFNGYSLYPDFITILITKRCNFNCYMCASGNPEYTRNFKEKELTIDELKGIIDQVKPWRPAIYINGGEPFLRGDLFELIAYCKSKGLITGLTTNGSFLSLDNVERIIDCRVDFFSLSIDGPEESHDQKRGSKGAFRKATEGLALLVKHRRKLPHIRIASILDCKDVNNSRYVLSLAKELGVDELAFGNLMFYTPHTLKEHRRFIEKEGYENKGVLGYEASGPISNDTERIKNFLEEIRRERNIKVTSVPANILQIIDDYYSDKGPLLDSICLSPFYSAVILPDGGVAPCQEFVVGNLRDKSFRQIWNGKKLRRFRKLRKQRTLPACFRCGEGQVMKFTNDSTCF